MADDTGASCLSCDSAGRCTHQCEQHPEFTDEECLELLSKAALGFDGFAMQHLVSPAFKRALGCLYLSKCLSGFSFVADVPGHMTFDIETLRSEPQESKRQIEADEALKNLLGLFDNPITRRRLGGFSDMQQEAILEAREYFEKYNALA